MQIARLLGEPGRHFSSTEEVHSAVDERFPVLVEGLLGEAAACDDVCDSASALVFLADRMRFLGELLSPRHALMLQEALEEKVRSW